MQLQKSAEPENTDTASRAWRNLATEWLSGVTSIATPAAIGSVAKGRGALIGALAGLAANHVAAPLAALVTDTRTKGQQHAEDSKGHALRNLFMPFIGSYNYHKRVGRFVNKIIAD